MTKVLLREKAVSLRKEGYSVKEISDKLSISKSTSSKWVMGLMLNKKAQQRLIDRRLKGYQKATLYWKNKNIKEEKEYDQIANSIINCISKDVYHNKLFCALIYWCEGSKGSNDLRFTNSDPELIKTFTTLFRKAFKVDETKFRALIHLHEYHDESKQKKFWSDLTKIPENQFQKSYLKLNSAKRVRENYPGCISIKYYDTKILKELKAIYKLFFKYLV